MNRAQNNIIVHLIFKKFAPNEQQLALFLLNSLDFFFISLKYIIFICKTVHKIVKLVQVF